MGKSYFTTGISLCVAFLMVCRQPLSAIWNSNLKAFDNEKTSGRIISSSYSSSPASSAVVCVVAKDDEAYIDEWVDYHHALGFSHFFVYDNSDGNWLKQWGDERSSHVTVVHFPGAIEPAQVHQKCASQLAKKHTWAAFFGIEDFLILKKHDSVLDFLHSFCRDGAVSINLVLFGAAGRRVYSPKPVTKRFLYRDSEVHEYVKFIVRTNDFEETISQVPSNISAYSSTSLRLRRGAAVRDTSYHAVQGDRNARTPADIAVFHHYLRSKKEYRIKMGEGIMNLGESEKTLMEPKREFKLFNGTVFDDSAWKALTKLVPRYQMYDRDLTAHGPRFPTYHNETAAVCAFVIYEEAYIDEWVDYHRALGFSHFYIYDNSPDFEMEQWGSEKGQHVTVKHFPAQESQQQAYLDCLNTYVVKNNHTWVAFFDVDEMIHLMDHNNVIDLLYGHCRRGSLSLNWNLFGPGGRETYEPVPVTKRFMYGDKSTSRQIKTIGRVEDLDRTKPFNPHFMHLKNGSRLDVYGNEITGPAYYQNPGGPSDIAVVNHYISKSYKEFITKRMRGRADVKEARADGNLLEAAKKRKIPIQTLIYTEAGWDATKKFLPQYQVFDLK